MRGSRRKEGAGADLHCPAPPDMHIKTRGLTNKGDVKFQGHCPQATVPWALLLCHAIWDLRPGASDNINYTRSAESMGSAADVSAHRSPCKAG